MRSCWKPIRMCTPSCCELRKTHLSWAALSSTWSSCSSWPRKQEVATRLRIHEGKPSRLLTSPDIQAPPWGRLDTCLLKNAVTGNSYLYTPLWTGTCSGNSVLLWITVLKLISPPAPLKRIHLFLTFHHRFRIVHFCEKSCKFRRYYLIFLSLKQSWVICKAPMCRICCWLYQTSPGLPHFSTNKSIRHKKHFKDGIIAYNLYAQVLRSII